MMGYTYWKWKNKTMAQAEILPFLSSYTKLKSVWPAKIVIQEKDIIKFHEELKMKNIKLPEVTLSKMIEEELIKQMEKHFETSFYDHNKELPDRPNKYQLVQAYAQTFKKNMNYVPMLKRMAKRHKVKTSVKLLTEDIIKEVNKQAKREKTK